ncbi:hypothetical protein OIDMADRAFT_120606 [Oidiodendron maius Zn]|uniref:Uncharacterized protein n=1 Tax=Oidiodendron maius (strain Zn) TaxID=913774 RepID=A0A0C3CS67_OIDMZ|nr:hypothetical protein OIDMADRAFT_120606 [Oidiodendron maius Zn]
MEELGCWQEAERCDRAATQLLRIRRELTVESFEEVTQLVVEVEATSRILRDIYDLFRLYRARTVIVTYYLTLVLGCLQKTLRDMMIYISNDELLSGRQWVLMNERLGDQGDISLIERFILYFNFLVQCIRLFSRSPLYDPALLQSLRLKIIRLRRLRGIPEPAFPVPPHFAPAAPTQQDIESRHWAQKIFDEQPHSATGLRHRRPSRCFGPPMIEERLGISSGSVVLSKLQFDKNHLSVTLYLHSEGADLTRLLCRWMDPHYNAMLSCYGVHELCVRRKGSALQLRRWSNNRAYSTVWLALFFKTWESYISFLGRIGYFKAYRAGSKANMTIVTHTSASPDWITRHSPHRIWVRDIRLYIFCKKYKQSHQTRKGGLFEIRFMEEDGTHRF